MTDKEKIRKEVERLRNLHQMKYQQLDTNDNMSLVECGKRNLCNELLSFIDSLQEEPVSGLKTQHSSIGIPNIDDILEENGIDPNSKDAKILKECYYIALEKLKAHKL